MVNIVKRLQQYYEPIHQSLASIPTEKIAQQMIACAKSGLYSYTVCMIISIGNHEAGVLSATFSVVACTIYIFTLDFYKKMAEKFPKADNSLYPWRSELEFLGLTELVTTHLSSRLGFQASIVSTAILTFIPNALIYPPKSHDAIPFFAVIVYQVTVVPQ